MDQLLTVKELASKLNYSASGIYKLVVASKIPHIKIPNGGVRFKVEAINAWLEKRTVKAKS
jgi:excisionase family DNA binding protein